MKNKGQKNERTARLKSMILLVAFTAIMLIVSTYAWFSTQRAVTISNITGEVKVAEGLEISLDAKSWSYSLDLSNANLTAVASDGKIGTYADSKNHVPTELKPASTIGAVGGTEVKFWTGNLMNIVELHDIQECDLTEGTATATDYAGYYALDVFLRDSSASNDAQPLYLSKDSAVTVKDSGDKETTGLQNTVRLALARFSGTAAIDATDSQIIAATVTAADSKIDQVTIWEPNSNFHVDYMVTNAQAYGGVITGRSQDKLATYAINDETIDGNKITNIYDVTEATRSDKLTQQTTVGTTITVPESGNPESYKIADKVALTTAANSATAFSVPANSVSRVRIYVWLEGQDHDCVNFASHGGGIEVDFGIEK